MGARSSASGRRRGSIVSGDVRYLQGGAEVESLVRAAGLVVEHAGVRTAVIGGLAVSCRLAVAHRVTGDVDVVADEPSFVAGGTAAENLVAAGIAEREVGVEVVRLLVRGTKVEIIETAAIEPADVAGVEPDAARLFVISHRWALECATPLRIGVVGSDVEVEVPVATSPALVAMKLHAIQDRHDDRKRASDAWDFFRLIDFTAGEEFLDQFAAVPPGLLNIVGSAVDRIFRQNVTRTRRWIQVYGDPEWATLASEDALVEAAEAFGAALQWALRSSRRPLASADR